jgi:hypothetical protein
MQYLLDPKVKFPVMAVWRQKPFLTGFNMSAFIKLQTDAYWCLKGRHHTRIMPQWKLQTAMMVHCSACQVRLPTNCSLGTNMCLDHFRITGMNRFCCFITITQIALSPTIDLANFSLKHGKRRPHSEGFFLCMLHLAKSHQPTGVMTGSPPVKKMMLICRAMQSLHLYKEHQDTHRSSH